MALRLIKSEKKKPPREEELGGQMSFLEHLDELRTRLIRSIIFVVLAATVAWFVSAPIYSFLARPINRALAEAQQQREVTIAGLNGQVSVVPLSSLRQNDKLRYAFPELTRLGPVSIPAGATVLARVDKDAQGNLGVFTDEPLTAGNEIIPKDVRLPLDLNRGYEKLPDPNEKLIVTTALEPFALYVKVALYAAIGVSVPFILWQIWAFVAPGLYPHERK